MELEIKNGAEKMTYLMNPHTGTVETEQVWTEEGHTINNSDFIEVVKDENGDWIDKV